MPTPDRGITNMADLKGQVALVTGASRGVGCGVAVGLAHAGATVFATGRTIKENEPGERIRSFAWMLIVVLIAFVVLFGWRNGEFDATDLIGAAKLAGALVVVLMSLVAGMIHGGLGGSGSGR
jgi:NAD(P)-dependent dehydrogenase (short-subunit alcohol dehydrogenase family)